MGTWDVPMDRAASISNFVELQLGVTMSAAVNLVGSQDSARMVEVAPASMRYEPTAVLGLGWLASGSGKEMTVAEAASAMAEAVTVMEVAAAAAVAVRKSHQSGLAKPAAPHPRWAE